MVSKAPIRRQFLSVICAHFLTASFGAMNGWAAVNFVNLQKDDTTFPSGPLTLSQATFMMSIAFIPSIIGNLVFPDIVKRFGCKRTIYAMGFPQIMVWLLIIYAQNHYYLYAARALAGLVAVGLMVANPIFVLSVGDDRFRGTLLSFFDPFMNLGTASAFVLAKYLDYNDQAKCHLIMVILFVILFARIPESPQHLVSVQRPKAASKAHIFYKGIELEKLPVEEKNEEKDDAKFILSDFTNPRARRAIIIAITLLCLNGLQGFMVIASYVTDILASSNPDISPIDASIGITMMLVGANLIFMNIVDRAARRVFYISSSIATTIGLALFAAYLQYLSDNHAYDWVPIVCVSFSLIVSCLGMSPIPYIIMFEIVPEKIKNYVFSCCFLLTLLISFILTEMFPLVKGYIGLFGCITFFAAMSLLNALYAMFIVPETKGKSRDEIMKMLDQ